MPDALPRLPRADAPMDNVDSYFPDNHSFSDPLAFAGPRGPVLDGVSLDHLTPEDIEGHQRQWPLSALLTETADRTAGEFLTESPKKRIIDGWQPDLLSFKECTALDPEAPIRRSSRARMPSVYLKPIDEPSTP